MINIFPSLNDISEFDSLKKRVALCAALFYDPACLIAKLFKGTVPNLLTRKKRGLEGPVFVFLVSQLGTVPLKSLAIKQAGAQKRAAQSAALFFNLSNSEISFNDGKILIKAT